MVAFPPSPQRVKTLDALRAQIERLTVGRPEAGRSPGSPVPTGWPSVDAVLPGGIPRGLVTEWFGVGDGPPADGATAPGSGPARRPRAATERATARATERWTPPLSLLVHVAHQAVAGARRAGPVLWIGRRVWPYGRALVRAGPSGARLLARSLFVAIADGFVAIPDGPTRPRDGDAGARLWALDLALRCRAVAAVVADGSGFTMAASRRLQVAAEAGQAFVALARPPGELDVPSAAGVRFVVTHVPAVLARTGAPRTGGPRPTLAWSLALRRAKGAAGHAAGFPPETRNGRTARGLEGPAVVLAWDAVHGVTERGADVGPEDRVVGRPASGPVVVPADVLDRPAAAAAPPRGRT